MKPDLEELCMCFPPSLLDAWQKGDYAMLTDSKASTYIKGILIEKAKQRQGRRFFGEAFIASRIEMKEGWYNSFKWLTQEKWLSGENLYSGFEWNFHIALVRLFGSDKLTILQERANALFNAHEGKLGGSKPVAPDLCIVAQDGSIRFIESKLPGDTIKAHQIAGMALIKKYLESLNNVIKVSIIELTPGHSSEPIPINRNKAIFTEFYNLA